MAVQVTSCCHWTSSPVFLKFRKDTDSVYDTGLIAVGVQGAVTVIGSENLRVTHIFCMRMT